MNFAELLLILVVALLVLGPKKMPMLAYHLGKLMRYCFHYKQKALLFWQQQYHLQENIDKAVKADKNYHSEPQDKSTSESHQNM